MPIEPLLYTGRADLLDFELEFSGSPSQQRATKTPRHPLKRLLEGAMP